MSNMTVSAVGKQKKVIESHGRDYGQLLWKQPHLLDLSYVELRGKNLEMKRKRLAGIDGGEIRDEMLGYLAEENGVRTVVVCFSDLEGRLQSLEYDKDFMLGSYENLTFDGSSITGFTELQESDLRLVVDWSSFRWVPADVFGAGKVLVFANVCNKDYSPYLSDFRSTLSQLAADFREKEGFEFNVAPEIEGFLFKGNFAEQNFEEGSGFELVTDSGYFSAVLQDDLKRFMDKFFEVQVAMGFENEKNHPEVAPAQFELNFRYSLAVDTADQIQLYKLLAREIANSMGCTASFLPKPVQNLNGSGMHTNMSISKEGGNLFYGAGLEGNLSKMARDFITGVLYYANDLCLVMNSSVNAYRRLDPNYEAPNEIKSSAIDRSAMVRIPMGNEKSARIEVRTVAPDANPYLCFYALIKAGMQGVEASDEMKVEMEKKVYNEMIDKLPGDIYGALDAFEKSEFMKEVLGEENCKKYFDLKWEIAGRSPRALGSKVKGSEVVFHHEVKNQKVWSDF